MQIVKMSSNAVIPTRATKYSVGLDFYSPSDYLICPLSQIQVPTQTKIRVPLDIMADYPSISGLATKHHMHVGAEVIDPGYIGEVKILLFNAGRHYYLIKKGIL